MRQIGVCGFAIRLEPTLYVRPRISVLAINRSDELLEIGLGARYHPRRIEYLDESAIDPVTWFVSERAINKKAATTVNVTAGDGSAIGLLIPDNRPGQRSAVLDVLDHCGQTVLEVDFGDETAGPLIDFQITGLRSAKGRFKNLGADTCGIEFTHGEDLDARLVLALLTELYRRFGFGSNLITGSATGGPF